MSVSIVAARPWIARLPVILIPLLLVALAFTLHPSSFSSAIARWFGFASGSLADPIVLILALALGFVGRDYKVFASLSAVGALLTSLLVVAIVESQRQSIGLSGRFGTETFVFRAFGAWWFAHIVNMIYVATRARRAAKAGS